MVVTQTHILREITYGNCYGKVELKLEIDDNSEFGISGVTPSLYFYCINNGSETATVGYAAGENYSGISLRVRQYSYSGFTSNWGQIGKTDEKSKTFELSPGESITELILAGERINYYYYRTDGFMLLSFKDDTERFIINADGDSVIFSELGMSTTIPFLSAFKPITASDFTDEGNPIFTYNRTNGKIFDSAIFYNIKTDSSGNAEAIYNNWYKVTSFQAALSFDGKTEDIAYRDVPFDGTQYEFLLTEDEREKIRQKAEDAATIPIYYLLKTKYDFKFNNTESTYTYLYPLPEFVSKTQRTVTIISSAPQLNPTVKDINPKTVSLTGDENKFIKYCSTAQFTIGATAIKNATIVNQYVTNGSQTVYNIDSGTIENVDSDTFYFSATDNRGLTTQNSLTKELIPYVKLTSRISTAKLNVDGSLEFTVIGTYYNGSFGIKNNSLNFQYGLQINNGELTWYTADVNPVFSDNIYTINHTVTGFNYKDKITLTVKIADELLECQTEPKVITSIPVFDWSESDFNFNVPVLFNQSATIKQNTNNELIISTGINTEEGQLKITTDGKLYIDTFNLTGIAKAMTQKIELPCEIVTLGSNYSNAEIYLYLYGNMIHGYFSATRKNSSITEDITNELVCEIEFDSAYRVTSVDNNVFYKVISGGIAEFRIDNASVYLNHDSVASEKEGKGTFQISLNAVGTNINDISTYFILPVTVDLDKF